jgi:dTDP-4-amino-4,6-dideoxy-D-galactose acyltransferase
LTSVCELLDWDSRFFGVRVARVVGHTLDDATARSVLSWCNRERIECLYLLAEADSEETVRTAEKYGFGLKDVRVTYRKKLGQSPADVVPELPPGVRIRSSYRDDAAILEAIAEGSYLDSRFYYDRGFPRKSVDELYRTWVRQSIAGQADVVLVLENEGRASGFITCHILDERTGQCRLGGLDASLRGRGLGQQMYQAALHWFAGRGIETVVYVTQARNIRAQRLFQRLGFLSHSTQYWYHQWFDTSAGTGRKSEEVSLLGSHGYPPGDEIAEHESKRTPEMEAA